MIWRRKMTSEQKDQLVASLCDFVARVSDETGKKTPEEIAALPAVVEQLIKFY